MRWDIFLSYCREDLDLIDLIMAELSQSGFRVWLDRQGIEASMNWRRTIVEAINNCSVIIVGLSPNAVRSRSVETELGLAMDSDKPIIPIYLVPTPLERLAYYLTNTHAIFLEHNDIKECVRTTAKALKSLRVFPRK